MTGTSKRCSKINKFYNTRGFAGGLNGRQSQNGVMPKILVAAMDVVKDGGDN